MPKFRLLLALVGLAMSKANQITYGANTPGTVITIPGVSDPIGSPDGITITVMPLIGSNSSCTLSALTCTITGVVSVVATYNPGTDSVTFTFEPLGSALEKIFVDAIPAGLVFNIQNTPHTPGAVAGSVFSGGTYDGGNVSAPPGGTWSLTNIVAIAGDGASPYGDLYGTLVVDFGTGFAGSIPAGAYATIAATLEGVGPSGLGSPVPEPRSAWLIEAWWRYSALK